MRKKLDDILLSIFLREVGAWAGEGREREEERERGERQSISIGR